jgi:hypothetical protein
LHDLPASSNSYGSTPHGSVFSPEQRINKKLYFIPVRWIIQVFLERNQTINAKTERKSALISINMATSVDLFAFLQVTVQVACPWWV